MESELFVLREEKEKWLDEKHQYKREIEKLSEIKRIKES